jgi:hypothetical protein
MTFLRRARQLGLALTAAAALPVGAAELNDYPTAARADYVFACMKSNGDTRPALEKCSCSIDIIASILPYDRYVEAETFLSLSQCRAGSEPCSNRLNKQERRSTTSDAHKRKARYAVFDLRSELAA